MRRRFCGSTDAQRNLFIGAGLNFVNHDNRTRFKLTPFRTALKFENFRSKCYKFAFCCGPSLAYTGLPAGQIRVPGRGSGNAARLTESRHNQGAFHQPACAPAPQEKWRSFRKEPVTSVRARMGPSRASVPKTPKDKKRIWRIVHANLAKQCLVTRQVIRL